jgi:hypothetical protein
VPRRILLFVSTLANAAAGRIGQRAPIPPARAAPLRARFQGLGEEKPRRGDQFFSKFAAKVRG